jgi:hypothetical protein
MVRSLGPIRSGGDVPGPSMLNFFLQLDLGFIRVTLRHVIELPCAPTPFFLYVPQHSTATSSG